MTTLGPVSPYNRLGSFPCGVQVKLSLGVCSCQFIANYDYVFLLDFEYSPLAFSFKASQIALYPLQVSDAYRRQKGHSTCRVSDRLCSQINRFKDLNKSCWMQKILVAEENPAEGKAVWRALGSFKDSSFHEGD